MLKESLKPKFGIATLVTLVVAVGLVLRQGTVTHEGPVILPSQVMRSERQAGPASISLSTLIAHRSELHLIERQLELIRTLEAAEARDTQPVQAEIQRGQQEFEQFVRDATDHGGAAASALQARAAPVIASANQLSRIHETYNLLALEILTPEQRRTADRLETSRSGLPSRLRGLHGRLK